MLEAPSIQWFPGHMTKTRRMMEREIKLVDLVVELLDARIPYSSSNPEIDRLFYTKPRLVILNKADIADPNTTKQWASFFEKKELAVLALDARSGRGVNHFAGAVQGALAEQRQRLAAKGMAGRPIRLMVVGVPNVGKSSLMNRLCGSRRAKVEDRPGVTRGRQWVTTATGLEILDTPGILWPKFEDKLVGEKLAFTGAVKDDILDMEHLAMRLLELLSKNYSVALTKRYKLDEIGDKDGVALLEELGRKRGMMMAGGHIDLERAARTLLDEFRGGVLGRISLESPPGVSKGVR